jgi:hypothetical protein
LTTNDRSKFRAKKEDIVALLDALQELFKEHRDKVTPKRVAERMAQKLHKQIPLHIVDDITASLGFITMRGTKHGETNYIIPNPELLAERRDQFCKDDFSSNNYLSKC